MSREQGSGRVDLARLLVFRNLTVAFIALAAMVAIMAIVQRRGVGGLPDALSFDKPGQYNPFQIKPEVYIDRSQTWSYADVENSDLSARVEFSGPVEFTWYCGCPGTFDPAKEESLFVRADPQAEKARREKTICRHCQCALDYLEWKEQRRGR